MEGTLVRDKQKDTLLYAGQLRVRITDWFFLKDKAELKYIGLEDAVIKLQRKDSTWNYQFIADYFASPKPKKQSQGGIEFNLKKVDFKNVTFIQTDNWRGERLTGKVGSLLLDADNMNFNKSDFVINTVTLDNPYFSTENIPELRPAAIKQALLAKEATLKDTGLQFNPGVRLHIDKLVLNNGSFISEADNDKPSPHFDGSHIQVKQINGVFNNLFFNKDTLTAKINISARERCGLNLKRLKARLKITPQIIEFAKLDLETNKSHLGDYYAMKFRHFNKDFGEYITNVLMDAKFKDAKVSSDDIAFFAPELKPWKKEVMLSGVFSGTVADFNIRSLFARSGNTTTVSGDLSMKGLPYINSTVINFNNGTIKTNYQDLSVFIPPVASIKEPNLSILGTMLFRGSFNGTINNFKTVNTISTSIGGMSANIAMQFPRGKEPSYTGSLVTNRFNLGKLIENTSIGLVDFNGKVAGSSFNLDKLNTHLDGYFSQFEFNGYNYTAVQATGDLQKKYFNGEFKIDDPNFNFTSTVIIDLTKPDPSFNVLGDLVKCDFQKINITPNDKFELTGLFDLNFTGKNIDQFLGTAKILNANLTHDKNKLSFDSLVLRSEVIDSNKSITATSNEFTCTVSGKNYKLLDMPTAFQSFMHHYYPAYFKEPVAMPTDQDFNISFTTKEFDSYARIIDKHLSGLDFASLKGEIDTKKNQFSFSANIPNFSYDKYQVTDANIKGDGNLDTLNLTTEITNVKVSDSLNFPVSTVHIQSSNDRSVVSLTTRADNTLNEANLNADVFTLEDGVRIHFNPSSFVLNAKKWNLEKEGEIVVRKNFVSAENVKFTQGYQEIKVETEESQGGNTSELVVRLKNLFLGDVTSLFVKNPQFQGVSSGEIRLTDFFDNFKADADIQTEQFKMNDDSVGLVNLKASYSDKTGVVQWKQTSANKDYHFESDGSYKTKDTTGSPLAVNIQLTDSTKVEIVQQFLGDIFSNISGKAIGNLSISGDPSAPDLSGKLKLLNAGMKVIYTQVYYHIDSAEIEFTKDGINFGEFTVKDRYNNTATVRGSLKEKGFKNLAFDFDMETRKLLLIDTKAKDNKLFYGKAIGKASISLKGPEAAAKMLIVAESNDSSHIYIPSSNSKESGDAGFIVFKQYGTEMSNAKAKENFDLTVDLDLHATDDVAIDVILDASTGDVITANGDGRLRIIAGTSIEPSIKGRYNIGYGNYNFNFQSFIRKPFELLSDAGNYIEWNGDPFNANIHIDARYTAKNVSVSDLISGQQQVNVTSSTRAYRDVVYVIAELRNKLTKPDITFRIDFPQSSPIKTDAVFSQFLTTIESNQNEMLSQATSLIVFGTFAPYGQGLLGGGSGTATLNSFGVNSLSGLLTSEINKALSGFLYKLTKDRSLHVDLGASVYSSSTIVEQGTGGVNSATNTLDRTTFNFKISKSFLHDNLIISFGGDLDFGLGNTSTIVSGNFQWLPNFNAEYVLTQDRRLRAIIFSKNSLDVGYGNASAAGATLARRTRQGVGLSYKREFETLFGDSNSLFKKRAVDSSKDTTVTP